MERHIQHHASTGEYLRVWIHDVEVTDRCVIADDREGYVVLLCRDPATHQWDRVTGPPHLLPDHDGKPCEHRVLGPVRVVPERRPAYGNPAIP